MVTKRWIIKNSFSNWCSLHVSFVFDKISRCIRYLDALQFILSTNLSVLELPINIYLPFCDITCEIWSRMCDIWFTEQKTNIRSLSYSNLEEKVSTVISVLLKEACNTIIGHGQYRNLGDGALPSFNTSSTLIYCCQICIHVPRIPTPSWHFLSRSRYLQSNVTVFRLKKLADGVVAKQCLLKDSKAMELSSIYPSSFLFFFADFQ